MCYFFLTVSVYIRNPPRVSSMVVINGKKVALPFELLSPYSLTDVLRVHQNCRQSYIEYFSVLQFEILRFTLIPKVKHGTPFGHDWMKNNNSVFYGLLSTDWYNTNSVKQVMILWSTTINVVYINHVLTAITVSKNLINIHYSVLLLSLNLFSFVILSKLSTRTI